MSVKYVVGVIILVSIEITLIESAHSISNLNSILQLNEGAYLHLIFMDDIILKPFQIPVVITNVKKIVGDVEEEMLQQSSMLLDDLRIIMFMNRTRIRQISRIVTISHYLVTSPNRVVTQFWLQRILDHIVKNYYRLSTDCGFCYSGPWTQLHLLGSTAWLTTVSTFLILFKVIFNCFVWKTEQRIHGSDSVATIQSMTMVCYGGPQDTRMCKVSVPLETLLESPDYYTTVLKHQLLENYFSNVVAVGTPSDSRGLYIPLYLSTLEHRNVKTDSKLEGFIAPLILGKFALLSNHTFFQNTLYFDRPVISDRVSNEVITGNDHFTFISCATIHGERVSFAPFLQPFELEVWIGLVSVLMMTLTANSVIMYCQKNMNAWNFFIFPAILLEQSPHVPQSLAKLKWFNTILIMWCLVSVELINDYKGIVTTDIVAPRPKQYFETPTELLIHNADLYVDMVYLETDEPFWSLYYDLKNDRISATDFSKSFPNNNKALMLQRLKNEFISYSEFSRHVQQIRTIQKTYINSTKWHIPNLLLTRVQTPAQEYLRNVEDTIGNCKNNAYIAPRSVIIEKFASSSLNRFEYNGKEFHLSGHQLLDITESWLILGQVGHEYVMRRFEFVMESGMYFWWEKRLIAVKSVSRQKLKFSSESSAELDVSTDLNSNIVVTFIVFLACCGFCVAIVTIEYLSNYIKVIQPSTEITSCCKLYR